MKHFTSIQDVPHLPTLLDQAMVVGNQPRARENMGHGKTLGLIFFNPSLRTRLSSQIAAQNLGMSAIVMNIGKDGWKLEFEDGAVMDGDTVEHVKDAAAVMGNYCDIIGIRAFASLTDRELDYKEAVLQAFMQYAGVPIVSLESATRHPLQSLADLITINAYKKQNRPKVVLSWAPHPKALPQAVANSFVEWISHPHTDVDLVITHPEGYELSPSFAQDVRVEYDQLKAFEGADFIYTKNWSSYVYYGQVLHQDSNWRITAAKMELTNNAYFMHCLPVRRNVVVDDIVLDNKRSLVQQQAKNRIIAAQTVLEQLITHNS